LTRNKYGHAAALILLLLVMLSCSGGSGSRIIKVVKGDFHIKVNANGQLRSTVSTRIGCPAIYRMWQYTIKFMAPEGKEVKTGQRILAFDDKSLREKLQLKQSELETAKKELEKTRLVEQEARDTLVLQLAEAKVKKEKARQKTIKPEELVALNEVKKLRMDLEMAVLQEKLTKSRVKNQKVGMNTHIRALENKIKQLQNEVNDLNAGIEKMKIKAPKAGVVVYSADWRGRKKAVGDTCWFGEKIMELPDLTKMEVAAVIPEPKAGDVKVGLAAEIRLDSNPDKVYNGKVKELGRIFRTKSHDQPAMVFDAVIEVKDPDPELMRPGMAASVEIIVSSKKDVLQIPEAAIIYHEKGLFVLKKTFTGTKRSPVSIGARSSGMVEVLKGLDENDRVVIQSGVNGEKQ
jgi:RND family efflux transporter MFP subunit